VEVQAAGMLAYVWRQPDDARRAETCVSLPAHVADHAAAALERSRAP
jgi:hypothetical protein